jgi:hypothetical protein
VVYPSCIVGISVVPGILFTRPDGTKSKKQNNMRQTHYFLLTSTAALAFLLTAGKAMAQTDPGTGGQRQGNGRTRNFDPAQFQQRLMDRYRERLEITDDAEWKAIQPLIQNVLDARTAIGGRGLPPRGGRRGGDANANASEQRGPGRENPAADELQKVLDAKAPAPETKAALAKYIEYRKTKQADLEKARDALRAVLTARQEAIATLSGLL